MNRYEREIRKLEAEVNHATEQIQEWGMTRALALNRLSELRQAAIESSGTATFRNTVEDVLALEPPDE